MSVERFSLSLSLLPLILCLALAAPAAPIQWSDAGEGVNPVGIIVQNGGQLVYVVTIYNYGTGDADNMVSETIMASNGALMNEPQIYVRPDSVTPWELTIPESSTPTRVSFVYFVPASEQYQLKIIFSPGCDPGRLTLSAMSYANGPFNDLIIGPPYAQPMLALSRSASAGSMTNAVALSVSSDAETFLLQYRDTLSATNWADLARIAVTGAVTVVTDTNVAPARFYRAVIP